jgi:hypothetical protein
MVATALLILNAISGCTAPSEPTGPQSLGSPIEVTPLPDGHSNLGKKST